jgi:DNA-binding transcriptional LysR family regulator
MKALDVEAVQAFVLVADLRSFTRAAEAMDTTQSAVSLKIKRLEDGLGRRLLERTPRLVRLSAEGSAFLGPARALFAAHQGALGCFTVEQRKLVVGISHHVVGAELPTLLKRLVGTDPGVVLEIRVAMSRYISEEFERGGVDAAIVLRTDTGRRDGEVILKETFGWMAHPASSTARARHCVWPRSPSRAACAAWRSRRSTTPALRGPRSSSATAS